MTYRPASVVFDPARPYANDALDRKPLVDFLAGVIEREDGALVLSLDSPWGTGKTTFLDMLSVELSSRKCCVIRLNAWKDDYLSDPLVALLSQIDVLSRELLPDAAYQHVLAKIKVAAGVILRRGVVAAAKVATVGIVDLDQDVEAALADVSSGSAEELLQNYKAERDTLDLLARLLNDLAKQLRGENEFKQVVVLIDELDRCRPDYAVRMLERVKHVFDSVGIVFLLAIDRKQLESSVRAVYGEGINAPEYLRRFIDLEFRLPSAPSKKFLEAQLPRLALDNWFGNRNHSETRDDGPIAIEVLSAMSDLLGFSLRVQVRCLMMLRLVADQTTENHRFFASLTSFLIALRVGLPELYRGAVDGRSDIFEVVRALEAAEPNLQLNHSLKVSLVYYCLGDPVRERREGAKDALQKSGLKWAEGLVELMDRRWPSFDMPSISQIAKKIDLASSLRDEY